MKVSYYLKKNWIAYTFAVVCTIAAVIVNMLSPLITKQIINKVIMEGKLQMLGRLLFLLVLMGVLRAIFQYFKELTYDSVSSKIAIQIRKKLFVHIQNLSLNFFDNNNTGELMSRVKDDVDRLWGAFGYVTMLLIEIILHTGVALFFMYRLNPSLALIPTIVLPCVAGLGLLVEHKLGSIYEQISEENAKLNTVAQENLAGVRTVKSFAREKHEIQKFLSHNKQYYELNMKQSKVFIKLYPYFQLITKMLPLMIIVFGGLKLNQGSIDLGDLGAFIEYSMNIVWPMEMLGWLANDFASAIASYKRINKIFQEKPEIVDPENPTVFTEVKGSVEFNKVSFTFHEKEVLSDISFRVEAGKTLGIMGATGTGKTSIINLLQRFYDLSEGEIRLDGENIKNLTLKQLRESISLVMQDVFLFSDTISENIKMGKRKTMNHTDILDAVNQAQAKDFIERMDLQYETVVGERGVGLSGGQKQRISIARALAKHTPILVLDDSTSALDMETEHMIQKALTEIESTKIIIAHRISAVRNADEIIILDEGRIAERGTHESLLQQKGYYYKTYMAQYGEHLFETDDSSSLVASCGEV